MEEGNALFLDIKGPSVRPEGSFRSSGSSIDTIVATKLCLLNRVETRPPLFPDDGFKFLIVAN